MGLMLVLGVLGLLSLVGLDGGVAVLLGDGYRSTSFGDELFFLLH
jgi:hypothetical protein